MDYRQFLHELFDTKPDAMYINIWTLPHKFSHFFSDIDKAAKYIDSVVNKKIDIYVACGLTDKLPRSRRGKKKQILAIPGFGMDIDFQSTKKPHCPKNIEDVIAIIKGNGWDPSLIILTGHGCHVWWLFKECWVFEDDHDRKLAQSLSERLQLTIKQIAKDKNFLLDSTHDLSRVLRLPETFNNKSKTESLPTSLFEDTGIRYTDPLELDDFLVKPKVELLTPEITEEQLQKIKKDLTIDHNAQIDDEMVQQLIEIEPKFLATWQQQRADFKDPTPSAYAMSLADLAAQVGWSDEDITHLIISWNRNHGHDLNKLHPAKMATTIQKAREHVKKKKIDDYMDTVAPVQGTKFEKIVDPTGDKIREATCTMLGIKIVKLFQYEQENSSAYRMLLADGTYIQFLTPNDLLMLPKFATIVYERTRKVIDVTGKQWRQCKKNFTKFITVITAGSRTVEERMAIWLEMYLSEKPPSSMTESLDDSEPFVYQGYWWVYASKFRDWVIQYLGENKTMEKSELELKLIKAERFTFTRTRPTDGIRKTIRPWRIPIMVVHPPVLQPDNLKPQPTKGSDSQDNIYEFTKLKKG